MGIDSRQWYRDEERARMRMPSLAPVTKALIIANIAMFIMQGVLTKFAGWDPVGGGLGMVPQDVIGKFYIWQIFTSMFLHDPGGIWHILINMLILFMFGTHVD